MAEAQRLDPAAFIHPGTDPIAAADLEAARRFGSATLHEAAGRIGALPSAIKPVVPGFAIAGQAVPVASPPADNLWLHRALAVAGKGDVLVVDVNQAFEYGYWGEVMSTAAMARGLAGLVINGCVRDVRLLEELGFPICARGLCIRGTGKDLAAPGSVNAPIWIGDCRIFAGDLVVGDEDGVVVIPRRRIDEVLVEASRREAHEAEIMRRLRAGETSLHIYGWE